MRVGKTVSRISFYINIQDKKVIDDLQIEINKTFSSFRISVKDMEIRENEYGEKLVWLIFLVTIPWNNSLIKSLVIDLKSVFKLKNVELHDIDGTIVEDDSFCSIGLGDWFD